MPSGVYPEAYEQQICRVCYLPDCIEYQEPVTREARMTCPLRVAVRRKLTAQQGQRLSQVAKHWGYGPGLYLRMVKIQVERNAL